MLYRVESVEPREGSRPRGKRTDREGERPREMRESQGVPLLGVSSVVCTNRTLHSHIRVCTFYIYVLMYVHTCVEIYA